MSYITNHAIPVIAALGLLIGSAGNCADVTFTPDAGGYQVHTANYDVTVLPDGCLTSIRSGSTEFINPVNEFKKGAYFLQSSLILSSGVELQGNTISANADRASVKYEFSADTITCNVTNLTSEIMNYFIIFDGGNKVASSGNGKYLRTPLTKDWKAVTFYRNDTKVSATGASKLWGPWNGHQVFDVTLGGGETRKVTLTISKIGSDEMPKVLEASIPEELRGADINILSPRFYQVFQRKTQFDGQILVSGWVKPACDKLMVRVTGKSLKGDLPGTWKSIALTPGTRSFSSMIPVKAGGWYTVEFKATNGGKVVAQNKVDKVGVGEVFVGTGQSNSTNCGQEQIKQTSGMVSSFSGTTWQIANDPQPGPHDMTTGGSFWPAFGDAMYAKYKVPIGVAVTGHGGTNVTQWQPEDPLGLFPWMMTRMHQLGPNGFRAVLWHQGESDATTPTDEYFTKMSILIRRSTYEARWEFPWFVAHASYHNATNPSWPLVRAAQSKLWEEGVALQGPDTDVLMGDNRDFDGAGIHFSPKGLRAHGKMWAESVGVYLDKVLASEGKSK
ncbi:MAG: sialate O-acetylesterase [Armatimonadota bacterium]